jgi:DNA-binding NarL/FixJ family response regulator
MTRVMIVDDPPIWRDARERDLVAADTTDTADTADTVLTPGTASTKGFIVVGAFGDAAAAVRAAAALVPDVVLMDLQLPGLSGVDAVRHLVGADPSVRVLMFSSSGEDADVLAAVKAGARGYLVKSARSSEVIDAVRRTAAGEAVFSPGLAALVLGEHRRIIRDEPDPAVALTEREIEVLRAVSTGQSARQIAERLVVSHRTVQNHIQNTLRKLQLHNRVELTRWALDHGLSEQP